MTTLLAAGAAELLEIVFMPLAQLQVLTLAYAAVLGCFVAVASNKLRSPGDAATAGSAVVALGVDVAHLGDEW